jgi:xylose isomerase
MPDSTFKFSFGPWNIHSGADPFGPPVRAEISLANKLAYFKRNGFDAIQLHDDDAVPNIMDMAAAEAVKQARDLSRLLHPRSIAAQALATRPPSSAMWARSCPTRI